MEDSAKCGKKCERRCGRAITSFEQCLIVEFGLADHECVPLVSFQLFVDVNDVKASVLCYVSAGSLKCLLGLRITSVLADIPSKAGEHNFPPRLPSAGSDPDLTKKRRNVSTGPKAEEESSGP